MLYNNIHHFDNSKLCIYIKDKTRRISLLDSQHPNFTSRYVYISWKRVMVSVNTWSNLGLQQCRLLQGKKYIAVQHKVLVVPRT